MKQYVYVVSNEWSLPDSDSCGTSITVFSSYEKALEHYKAIVKDEKSECWSYAFHKNGAVRSGYVVEKSDSSWTIYEKGFYVPNHTCVKLEKLEVI